MAKNSFVIYHNYRDTLEDLTDEQVGILFRAIFDYEIDKKEPSFNGELKMAFRFIKKDLDLNSDKYTSICERNRMNGLKGGRPKNPKNPDGFSKTQRNPETPKKADNDNDNDYDNDYILERKKERKKDIGQSLDDVQHSLISNNLISNNNNINNINKEIIDYLNEKAKTKYRQVESNYKHIQARVSEGFTLDDFKTVIDKKCQEWIGTEFERYLTPETLFRPSNFEKYLNQKIIKTQNPKEATKREYSKEELDGCFVNIEDVEI